jgi:hypothetical protein
MRRWQSPRGHPPATGVSWLLPVIAVFFVIAAAAGALAGGKYVIAAVGVSLIPLTAIALIAATTRAKTAGDDDDVLPGMGMDDETPLGDTSEHSDAERVAPDPRA